MAIRLNFFDGLAIGFGSMLWLDGVPQLGVMVFLMLFVAGVIFGWLQKEWGKDDADKT